MEGAADFLQQILVLQILSEPLPEVSLPRTYCKCDAPRPTAKYAIILGPILALIWSSFQPSAHSSSILLTHSSLTHSLDSLTRLTLSLIHSFTHLRQSAAAVRPLTICSLLESTPLAQPDFDFTACGGVCWVKNGGLPVSVCE
jgi:hypothetical protein